MEARSFNRWTAAPAPDLLPPQEMRRKAMRLAPADVVDAEFVVVGVGQARDAGSRSSNDNRNRPHEAAKAVSNPRMPGTGLVPRLEQFLQRASLAGFITLVVSLVVLIFGLSGGFSILSPSQDAGLPSPLHFTHVTTTHREANGMPILMINGIVENQAHTTQMLRPIRADVMSGGVLAASVVIGPPANVVYAGQSLGFSTRIRYSGVKSPEVQLSFMP